MKTPKKKCKKTGCPKWSQGKHGMCMHHERLANPPPTPDQYRWQTY